MIMPEVAPPEAIEDGQRTCETLRLEVEGSQRVAAPPPWTPEGLRTVLRDVRYDGYLAPWFSPSMAQPAHQDESPLEPP